MSWYYVVDGASRGPVQEGEIAELFQNGGLSPETLVWKEGMDAWIPLQESPLAAAVQQVTASPVAASAQHVCAECGKTFPDSEMIQYEQSWVCAGCKPVFIQRMMEGAERKGTLSYASIAKRFVAVFIDGIIIFGVIILVSVLPMAALGSLGTGPDHETMGAQTWFAVLFTIISYGVGPAFEIFFIGKYGATPGKMLIGIKVVTPEGGRISYGRATGRYFGKIVSALILYIGYLMAFWDPERRALHDRMCGSRVINRER